MEKIFPKDSGIRGVMLTDGTEVIGKLTPTPTGYELENPMRIITRPTKDGGWEVLPMPFSLIAPKVIPLYTAGVLSTFPITKEMEDGYLSFTTGVPVGNTLLQG